MLYCDGLQIYDEYLLAATRSVLPERTADSRVST